MKTLFRIIGIVVVVVVLVCALLYFMNEKGILKGPISDWVTDVTNDILHIFGSTKDMVNDMSSSENPFTDSINIP
ncbi:MAG: hypothetical protein IJK54_01235 [Clostridia bacterium]|nr:hypothetical protein [Clostridia bacterium]